MITYLYKIICSIKSICQIRVALPVGGKSDTKNSTIKTTSQCFYSVVVVRVQGNQSVFQIDVFAFFLRLYKRAEEQGKYNA